MGARRDALQAWLDKINARCMWEEHVGNITVTGYAANGRAFIVQRYSGGDGWNIYTSADANDVDMSLSDAEKRIGL